MKSMLKIGATLLFLLIVLTTIAQPKIDNAINKKDAKGLKQGLWLEKYPHGPIKWEGRFKDGKPQGIFKHYNDNGKVVILELNYIPNTKKAYSKAFHENGKLMAEGYYIDKKKDSIWNYYNQGGDLISIENYTNTKKTGEWKTFYYNGQISKSEFYVNDYLEGPSKEYFENGQLKFEGTNKTGFFDGKVKFYHPNGKVRIEGIYKYNVRHGVWTYYDQSGKMLGQEIYKNGNLTTEPVFKSGLENLEPLDDPELLKYN